MQQAARAPGFGEQLERVFRHSGTALYFSNGNTTVEKVDRLLQRLCLEKPESQLSHDKKLDRLRDSTPPHG